MKEYIKTTISRTKLYERNYTRDSIEKIKLEDSSILNNKSSYKILIDILTQKYLDNKNI
ncbi:hypothetical protein JW813_06840 [Clostridium botulinum]|uniref:hypothetical protein n=1 Tax=Clostridium botulinum TaxID=1491 RepID=UPI002246B9A7|nr:hypothetical protein [Clostridium botulinum]UZP04721.1 hypothetical protein JW813_06840 [Clostridium botulinum]UZP08133.1 hypothetical protein JYA71_07115 [Clostridium botulinum]UZP11460.1 hypothetical protein JYA74_06835 [Clostridium botulinum]